MLAKFEWVAWFDITLGVSKIGVVYTILSSAHFLFCVSVGISINIVPLSFESYGVWLIFWD